MSFIHFARKEIAFKVVYYGPALSGKTTNLEQIHRSIDTSVRGELTILSTREDRTLFFDFLPLCSDIIRGFVSKFQLYTVPGQSLYAETRKLVLRNADAVVFVADSQWDKMEENIASLHDLWTHLDEHGIRPNTLPLVLQFNKRDLPGLAPPHYMHYLLNRGALRWPAVEATACECKGVFETLNLAARMTLADFMERNRMPAGEVPQDACLAVGSATC